MAVKHHRGSALGRAKGYFRQIHARLRECGYRVEARLLDAQWLACRRRAGA